MTDTSKRSLILYGQLLGEQIMYREGRVASDEELLIQHAQSRFATSSGGGDGNTLDGGNSRSFTKSNDDTWPAG
eukprot:scaffold117617_cov15-Prasinocladus_malaysianus.AAC.1